MRPTVDPKNKIDRANVLLFLGLTVPLSWAAQILLINATPCSNTSTNPLQMLALIGIMWIPGLCAIIIHCLKMRRPFKELGFRFGSGPAPWKAYLASALLIPVAYCVIYGLTFFFGLGSPDWNVRGLAAMQGAPISIGNIFGIMLPASIILGPVLNLPAALGEELGWRGFLLPKLMGYGKWRAYMLLGLIWGFWHIPLITAGFNYPGYPGSGVVMMIAFCTVFGAVINEFFQQQQSVILAAWMHGALNAQGYGIWHWLFPKVNPVWGGDTGFTALFVWGATALILMGFFSDREF